MPMRKGEWHRTAGGKLRRIRKHSPEAIPEALPEVRFRKVGRPMRRIKIADQVHTGKVLNHVADSLWRLLPIDTKLELLASLPK